MEGESAMNKSRQAGPVAATSLIELGQLGAPLVLCDDDAYILGATDSAWRLLEGLDTTAVRARCRVPHQVWEALCRAPSGRLVGIQAGASQVPGLMFRRHRHTEREWLVLMEIDPTSVQSQKFQERAERFEMLGCMAADISRELLEPLERMATAAGLASTRLEVLAQPSPHARMRELEARCRAQLESILRLVEFLENGAEMAEGLSLSACFARVHASLQAEIARGSHRVSYEVGSGADSIHAHPVAVQYVLRHVIGNAMQAGEGPVATRVRSWADRARAKVCIEVHDNGPGVVESMVPHLFTPMCSTKPNHAGVGLATSRALARDLGGDLRHVPARRGARFVVVLPSSPARGRAKP